MTTPTLTPYANLLLARAELRRKAKALLCVPDPPQERKGGTCDCGRWGTHKCGNEWECQRCNKAKRKGGFSRVA